MIALLAVTMALPARSSASCADGAEPDYADISAVGFERHGCGGFPARRFAKDLRCSLYALVVWPEGGVAEYDQVDLKGAEGSYKIAITLATLQGLLKRYDFYRLAPGEHYITDINYTIIRVSRCGVTSVLAMFPIRSFDPKVYQLFLEFDALVKRAPKVLVSHTPKSQQPPNLWPQ
jgi:hypothetical protein